MNQEQVFRDYRSQVVVSSPFECARCGKLADELSSARARVAWLEEELARHDENETMLRRALLETEDD